MNQQKIGIFLKELRKEKQITQEQLAEYLNVSNRRVSRWETGNNLPDLDILIQLSKYYDVQLIEILEGEKMKEEKHLETTVQKVAEYGNEEKLKLTRLMNFFFILGVVSNLIYLILTMLNYTSIELYNHIAMFFLGISFGVLVVGVVYTSKYMNKIKEFKMKFLNK